MSQIYYTEISSCQKLASGAVQPICVEKTKAHRHSLINGRGTYAPPGKSGEGMLLRKISFRLPKRDRAPECNCASAPSSQGLKVRQSLICAWSPIMPSVRIRLAAFLVPIQDGADLAEAGCRSHPRPRAWFTYNIGR